MSWRLIVGGIVDRIQLGLTPISTGRHWSFIFLGFRWELYDFPISGSVGALFADPGRFRQQLIIMAVAAPLTNLVLAILGGAALLLHPPSGF